MLVMTLCMYSLKITDVSRFMIGIFFLLDVGLLTFSKWSIYRTIGNYREKGLNLRNILIVGCRERARDVIDAIGESWSAGYRVLGCLDIDRNMDGEHVKNGVKVIGTIGNIAA